MGRGGSRLQPFRPRRWRNQSIGLSQACDGGTTRLNPGERFVVVPTLQATANRWGLVDASHPFRVPHGEDYLWASVLGGPEPRRLGSERRSARAGIGGGARNDAAHVPASASTGSRFGLNPADGRDASGIALSLCLVSGFGCDHRRDDGMFAVSSDDGPILIPDLHMIGGVMSRQDDVGLLEGGAVRLHLIGLERGRRARSGSEKERVQRQERLP